MRNIAVCALAAVLLLSGTAAWAVPVGDVGGLDPLFAVGDISSSAHSEAAWLNTLLGTSYDNHYIDDNKIDVDSNTWEPVVGGAAGQYAFKLPSGEGFFLVKTGNGTYDHWLFQNAANTDWATVVVGQTYTVLSGDYEGDQVSFNVKDIESISHIVPAGAASVPEPATMILLGLGLLGLVGFVRRKLIK